MTDHPTPSAGHFVVIHLLDSAQGHSLQTWRFSNQSQISIGRGEESDVSLSDPHVSRAHAKLVYETGNWTLFSTGRHGTLINDRPVSEFTMEHDTVFRLGAAGPTLRFGTHAPETRRSETMDNVDYDMIAMLEIDEKRKQHEVDQITSDALFQQLQEKMRRRKSVDASDFDTSLNTGQETA
jgi:predicted component of type VI protein secretion system